MAKVAKAIHTIAIVQGVSNPDAAKSTRFLSMPRATF